MYEPKVASLFTYKLYNLIWSGVYGGVGSDWQVLIVGNKYLNTKSFIILKKKKIVKHHPCYIYLFSVCMSCSHFNLISAFLRLEEWLLGKNLYAVPLLYSLKTSNEEKTQI